MSGRVQSLKSNAVLICQEVGTGFVVERTELEGREEEVEERRKRLVSTDVLIITKV